MGVVDVGDEHFFELPPTGTEIYPKHSIVLQLSSENEAFKEGPQKGVFFEKKLSAESSQLRVGTHMYMKKRTLVSTF